ncbi:MAG: PAS domain S-box protein [Blastocatellia bacterium]
MRFPGWKNKNTEVDREEGARKLHEAAWPDMFANLQSAYAELTNTQFELERRTAEIAETRDVFQQVVSSMSEALFLTDRSGRVIRANPAAATLLECSETSLIGRPLTSVCNSESIPATPWKLMEIAPGGKLTNLEIDLPTLSGLTIPVSFSLGLMHDKQNKVTGVLAVARDTRLQRSLINSLVVARARFEELLEFAPDAIVLANETGEIVLVNTQTEKLFGYQRDELLGQPVNLLIPSHIFDLVQRRQALSTRELRSLEDEMRDLSHSAQREISRGIEYTIIDRAGREVLTEMTSRQIETEEGLVTLSMIRDISARRRAENDKVVAETRYQELFENANDMIFTLDLEGNFTSFNRMAVRLTGYPAEQALRMNIFQVVAHNHHELIEEHLAGDPPTTDDQVSHTFEIEIVCSDNRRLPIEVSTRLILENGTASGVQGIARDITERRRIEEVRAELLAREQEARRVAEEASRMKDDFLAMISHELRAPLTSILGWAQMLRCGGLDRAAAERALQTIERNVKSQAHIVADLLDASRITTGKLGIESKPVELKSIVEAVVDAVRPMVEAGSLRLQMVLEPWVGPFHGDPERLNQIVWNLLTNAIKFTPPDGLIEVRLERLENKALLIISDTGKGIEPEFLPNIFDRFRQADSSSRREQGGLGLGLAIVKHLVELHHGAIYAYSGGTGKGSDFMITLPLAVTTSSESDAGLWIPQADPQAEARAASLRGVRALVVDDDHDTREILSVMLTRYGAEVRTASSSPEAFELFGHWRPDIVVSDIGMPHEDGYALIEKIRQLQAAEGGETPAIALTAFAGVEDRERAISSGFHLHLSKPVEPVHLARTVARTLGRSESGIEL